MPGSDFNGDGRDDILWRYAWPSGEVTNWLAGDGRTFGINTDNFYIGVPYTWNIQGTGDFDGDGHDDILWGENLPTGDYRMIGSWLGGVDGTLTINDQLLPLHVNFNINGIGDFDGDGRDEILILGNNGPSNALDFIFANDDAEFDFTMGPYASVPADWKIAGVGDFNGDGRDDILWRNDDGRIGNWLTTAQFTSFGGFGPGVTGFTINNASILQVSLDWSVASVGDFDGDGYDDILWRHESGAIGTWSGGEDGIFTINEDSVVQVPNAWLIVATGDYDGDGVADILWRNPASAQVGTWSGTETGGFEINPTLYTIEARWVVDPDIGNARGFLGLT